MPTPTAPATALPNRPPSLLTAAMRVFDLSIGQMLWSRRTIFLALVVAAPVVLAIVLRVLSSAGFGAGMRVGGAPVAQGGSIFGVFIWLLYLRFIVPVLGVFYGTSLIADEVEDRTITYLFTRPIPRGAVLVGKYLAYLAATILVVLPSVMVVYFLVVPIGSATLAASFPALLMDLALHRHRPGGLRRAVRVGRRPVQAPAGDRPGVRVRLGAGHPARPGLPQAADHRATTSRASRRTRCPRTTP